METNMQDETKTTAEVWSLEGCKTRLAAETWDYFSLHGKPGEWSDHKDLDEAIARAKSLGLSEVFGVRHGNDTGGIGVVWRTIAAPNHGKGRVIWRQGVPYQICDEAGRPVPNDKATPPGIREARSEAAAAMGRAKSPAKTAASRANGAKGGRPRKSGR